jgi:O-antigen biosynthesis protein
MPILIKVFKILREEGLTGLRQRLADHWEFQKARRIPEENSLEESLLADLARARKIKNKPYDSNFKLKHFLSQSNLALSFPEADRPVVSIILSAASRGESTYACLESILAYTSLPFELILIKASKEDLTTNLLIKKIKNIKLLSGIPRASFGENANRGARLAAGEFLVFLNGAARVTPQWASLMVEGAGGIEARTALGVKLVQPNGLLLEAGNLVLPDGAVRRYGAGDNPYRPEYSFVRQVDCCSPSCLLIRRALFQSLGGFPATFASPSYEAADLGLRLRQAGGQVTYYSPVTVSLQELSNEEGPRASDPASPKDDRSKFLDRWRDRLAGRPASATPLSGIRDLRPGKRILFIEDRIPAPAQGCGFPRSFAIVRYLAELGYIVTVLPSWSSTPWQPFTRELERLGVETLYGRTGNWRRFFKERANGYEVVWVSRHHNLPVFLPWLQSFLPQAALIFDSEALFSLRELERMKLTAGSHRPIREIQFQKRLQEEYRLMRQVDLVVTVSEKEKRLLEAAGIKNIRVWSHAVAAQPPAIPFHDRQDLLFVGGFMAPESPNTAAVHYFLDNIFPDLEKQLGCRLWIVGSNPPPSIRGRAGETVRVTGYQESLEPYYRQSRLFIVPHQYAGGIPLKLLEAMGRGLPAVVSALAAEQLGLQDEREVLIADGPEAFRRQVVRAYTDETLWSGLQKDALAYIEANCRPDTLKSRLQLIVETAQTLKGGVPQGRRSGRTAPGPSTL